MRLNPVAALEHLSGDERIAGLGRADQWTRAEARKRENRSQKLASGQRDKERAPRSAVRPGNQVGGLWKPRYDSRHPTAAKTPPSPPSARIHESCAITPSTDQSSSD